MEQARERRLRFTEMITPFRSDYACGLQVNRVNGRLVIEHGGNNIGFNAHLAYYPEEGLAVVVLANLNGTVVGKITSALGGASSLITPSN